jgi:hypothetical protein
MSGRDKWRFAAIGPREHKPRQGAIACKHLTSQYLAATRGGSSNQDLVACWIVRYAGSLMPPDRNHWDATGLGILYRKSVLSS